jgi:hypothetical protein
LGYGIGAILLVLASASLVAQLFSFLAQGAYRPIALGSIWYEVHANSLVGFQALIEQRVSPAVWPPISWVLGLPAWLVLGLLGAVLFFACRGGGSRGRGFD